MTASISGMGIFDGTVDGGADRTVEAEGLDPARLLRAARYRSELTQEELAGRAGVSTSSVSAFEKGRRTPSLPMLLRLLGAAGWQVRIELEPL